MVFSFNEEAFRLKVIGRPWGVCGLALRQIQNRLAARSACSLRQINNVHSSRLFVQYRTAVQGHLRSSGMAHTQAFCGGFAQVNDEFGGEGAAIIDANSHLSPVAQVDHANTAAQGQGLVCCGQGLAIETLSTGRAPPVPTLATVPSGPSMLEQGGRRVMRQGFADAGILGL
jgi:hypothetical protein